MFRLNVRRFILLLLSLSLCFSIIWTNTDASAKQADQAPGRKMAKQETKKKQLWITADHSKHEILQQDFKSGPEVTHACLSCHSEAASQFAQNHPLDLAGSECEKRKGDWQGRHHD